MRRKASITAINEQAISKHDECVEIALNGSMEKGVDFSHDVNSTRVRIITSNRYYLDKELSAFGEVVTVPNLYYQEKPIFPSLYNADNETVAFMPTPAESLLLYWKNEAFRGAIKSGRYVYEGGQFYLSNGKSVEYANGIPYLTVAARDNLSECLVGFCRETVQDRKYHPRQHPREPIGTGKRFCAKRNFHKKTDKLVIKGNFGSGKSSILGKVSAYEELKGFAPFISKIVAQKHVSHFESQDLKNAYSMIENDGDQLTELQRLLYDISEVRCIFQYGSLGKVLTALMSCAGITVEEMEERTHIDSRKIIRFRNGEYDENARKEDILAFIIGLKLPPPLGREFMDLAKIKRNMCPEDTAYEIIMGTMYKCSIDYVNNYLNNLDMKTIPYKRIKRNKEI